MLAWSVLALALAQACTASPLAKRFDDLTVRHSWPSVPSGWEFHSAPSPSQRFDMRIGINKANPDDLVRALYEVSDPRHEKYVVKLLANYDHVLILNLRYGQHLSKEEVEAMAAPHPDALEAVESWLAFHGLNLEDASSRSTNWVTITVTVEQAERMLGAKYGVYHHPQASDYILRTTSYSLPAELQPHIAVVSPTTYFGTTKAMRATSFVEEDFTLKVDYAKINADDKEGAIPSSCKTKITPACLIALYNTTGYVPSATDTNKLGIAGYLDEYANRADLQVSPHMMSRYVLGLIGFV